MKSKTSNKANKIYSILLTMIGTILFLFLFCVVLVCISRHYYITEKEISTQLSQTEEILTAYGWQEPESFSYQTAHAELNLPTPIPQPTASDRKTVYLTFDDGPSKNTDQILDILKEKDVPATFFLVPKDTESSRQEIQKIADAGHTIGVHSYTHNYQTIYSSVDAFLDDFAQASKIITEVTGTPPEIFRFPGGSINSYDMNLYQPLISEMLRRGYVYFDWNVNSSDADAKQVDAAKIEAASVSGVEKLDYAVLLLHDSNEKTTTVDALGGIIDQLKADGYQFCTLDRSSPRVSFTYKS